MEDNEEYRVRVKGQADKHQGKRGVATLWGKAQDNEDIYRVGFGTHPHVRKTTLMRARDLEFLPSE